MKKSLRDKLHSLPVEIYFESEGYWRYLLIERAIRANGDVMWSIGYPGKNTTGVPGVSGDPFPGHTFAACDGEELEWVITFFNKFFQDNPEIKIVTAE